MKYWVETNIASVKFDLRKIVKKIVKPLVRKLSKKILSWHFLHEIRGWRGNSDSILPHIRFRVEAETEKEKNEIKGIIFTTLAKTKLEIDFYFGRHGREKEEYIGEVDRFGEKGWDLTKGFLQICSEIALELLLKKKKNGPRFCKADLLHLASNTFGLRDFTFVNPTRIILLEKDDIPNEKHWEGA